MWRFLKKGTNFFKSAFLKTITRPEKNPTTLKRTLGLRDLILLIIGTVIGSGIFIVPGAVLRQTNGSIALAMMVWLAGGILSLLGALTYGELSAMNPKAGGLYIFIRDGFGIGCLTTFSFDPTSGSSFCLTVP